MIADRFAFLSKEMNFPTMEFQIKEAEGKLSIFDSLRKKYLILTPEEWVRQHMIAFLVQFREYPKSLFSLEKGLQYNSLQKRSDILVLDRKGKPFLIIECKAPDIALTKKTLEQVCVYNKTLQAPHLGITNGMNHLFYSLDESASTYSQIPDIPKFM